MTAPRVLVRIASLLRATTVVALAPALAALAGGCLPSRSVLPDPGSYELHDALELHLFAAEPDVVDPVALAFDAAERLYVVEMRDYPEGMPPDGRPGGTIRLLEDIDRDGRADRSTVFAQDLSFPTSVAPWKGGVFVTAPPQILYLEDTDGDRRADVREVVFDGFTLGVTDSNVNGLRWAIDNRIHGANGGNGGRVGETELRGLDFRFDPRTLTLEPTHQSASGFGLIFDDWGRSFAPYNIDHLQHRVLPERYLRRHPTLPPVDATVNVSIHGAMARIFPISAPATRPNHPEQAGHYSAAGGIGWLDFADSGLPRGILVCDVVGNLVSREVARDDGPIFATERAPEEYHREFFASRDPAFRPTGVEMGPDGALYLIDMQRDTIEHPDYIPASRRSTLDLRAGDDRGRIYRIVPRRGLPPREPPLAGLDAELLVRELGSRSRWRRDTAQRLLYERGNATLAAVERLRAMARADEDAPARLHALRTLEGLGAADEGVVLAALSDAHPGVRENALQVAETLLPGADALHDRILTMAGDPSARVRFQAALTLGALDDPRRLGALERILRADGGFRWSRIAVESSLLSGEAMSVLSRLLRGDGIAPAASPIAGAGARVEASAALAHELADLVGAELGERDAPALGELLRSTAAVENGQALRAAVFAGLAAGMARAASPPRGDAALSVELSRAIDSGSMVVARSAWLVRRGLGLEDGPIERSAAERAATVARDRARSIEERAAAVDLIALGAPGFAVVELCALLAANEPSELEAHAVRALGAFDDPTLGSKVIERFRGLGPQARVAAIGLLLRRAAFHADLIGALEDGRLIAGELNLDLEQRRRLLRSNAPGVAARAAAVLHDDDYGGRAAAVEAWLARLPARGSAEAGSAVYERLCGQCHQAGDAGKAVGPDLGSLSHRSVEDLVSNILDPDLAIHPDYVAFELETTSGEREVGLIGSESAAGVELLQAGGERRVIARSRIASLRSTGRSLMPGGLEQGLDARDLRDLVAFIQGAGYSSARR